MQLRPMRTASSLNAGVAPGSFMHKTIELPRNISVWERPGEAFQQPVTFAPLLKFIERKQ